MITYRMNLEVLTETREEAMDLLDELKDLSQRQEITDIFLSVSASATPGQEELWKVVVEPELEMHGHTKKQLDQLFTEVAASAAKVEKRIKQKVQN